MSKLQSSLQQAIEKTRRIAQGDNNASAKTSRASGNKGGKGLATGVFRILQRAFPREEVMEESKIVAAVEDKAAKSAYNVLRTRILQRMRSNNWNSLLITSAGPGEGKTLTSSNLAISIARDVNQSATLVDLDLMRSSVAKYLGISVDVKAGIGDYLQGKAEAADIIYSSDEFERLVLVPNREPIENSSDLIGSPRMRVLADALSDQTHKSIVIYDMPPVLACDDVLAFCPSVDAILLVVAQGKTERTALEKTVSMLSDYNIIGVVLNMSNEKSGDDAYGYY